MDGISPFPHHGPLRPDQVHGRDELVATLHEKLASRRVTALLGPRRFGKTSVLRKVAADLEAASTSVLWIDLFEVTSLVDLAARLDEAIAANHSRFGQTIRRLAASLDVTIGGVKLAFARPGRPDAVATVHILLDLIVESALDGPTVLVLDEFSSIANVNGAAGLFRTKLQHHFSEIGLVFAGSAPSTMKTMFEHREQPFYGQADLVTVGPLSAAAVHDLVTDGFRTTGRDPGPLPTLVHQRCAGHPRRTMQVADHAWQLAAPGADYDARLWPETINAVEASTDEAHEAVFAGLNDAEKRVLRLLASSEPLFGRAAELLGLNPAPAQGALARLTDAGHVADGGLVDPLLAHWVRRRLPI